MIWKKEIDATPISSISSDRICGIRIKSSCPNVDDITVIAVYLPCSDMGMECYSEHLIELEGQSTRKRINWSKVRNSTYLHFYQEEISAIVAPLIGNSYNSSDEIDKEIIYVSKKICSAALESLPLHNNLAKKRKWFKDQTLSRLASAKKAAWDKWSVNGRPKEGPLYDAKNKARAEFRKRMKVCAANSERKRIQHFDHQFKQRSSSRFKIPSAKKRLCPSLRVNQEVVTDPKTIVEA